jgi:putative glutamine amidotransferase
MPRQNVFSVPRRSTPLVGVVCDRQLNEGAPYLACEERYVSAIREGSGVVPFLIPSLEEKILNPEEILPHLDGLIFTGSPSNIHPSRYGNAPSLTPGDHDAARDAVSIPLLRAALEKGVPLLATCRGMQEMNVACGGSLHQKVHELPGYMDHREDDSLPYEDMYRPAHAIRIIDDGFLADLCGGTKLTVNSLHDQGIDRLGAGLAVEAVAPDGLIEAVRFENHPFAIGIQFHPEWSFGENSFSLNLFAAFGKALRGELDLRQVWPPIVDHQAKVKITA